MDISEKRTKTKLLFICHGNICRSPAAEGIIRAKVEERWLDDRFCIDSAGIGSWHVGEQPDRRMRKHAEQRGYDLSKLRARQFLPEDFDEFDYIVVMDEENYHDVLERMPKAETAEARGRYQAKVLRMKDFFQKFKGVASVPDPYYGGSEGFELALDLIEDGCDGLLSKLTED
ncbi:MAG: low molecular weight phosphotyrosine protein phosphatase [Prevotella sp.]|nr:low molecular weight phosphotyrosine protein phosphatase [Prevotella sp.]